MRRIAAGLVAVGMALSLTGCEDAQQRSARESLQTYLRSLPNDGGYQIDATRCTPSGRVAFVNVVATSVFFCLAHRETGVCDRFQVRLQRHRAAEVILVRRDASCVLSLG